MSIYKSSLDFYVYAYLRENGTPYYIGKGKKRRAWSNNHAINLPKDRNRIIIVEDNLTEIGAFALERRLIVWYGRIDLNTGILRNKSDGGEGSVGAKWSEETKLAIGNGNRGKKRSLESKERMRLAKLGKKRGQHSEEHKAKLSESLKRFGPHSDERKRNQSLAAKKRYQNEKANKDYQSP
jgi:NUMOD3 motif